MSDSDLLVAHEAANWDVDGQPVFVLPGDIAHRESPLIVGHEAHFRPAVVKFGAPEAKARAEREDEEDAPRSPSRADQRGARTRSQ